MAKQPSIVLLLALALPFGAAAQGHPAGFFANCEKERVRFCFERKESPDIAECLIHHDKELSHGCLQGMERFLQFRRQSASRGGGALSAFGGLNSMGPPIPLASYDGRLSPGASGSGPGFFENKANISAPVYKTATDSVALSLAGGDLHLNGPPTLNSGLPVPADLYRIEVGAQYFHDLGERKNWGLRTSVGYAGDKPFQNGGDTTYSLNLNYGFPGAGNGRWMTFLFYSNNSTIANGIPLPGAAYLYRSDTFMALFGFPIVALQWTPVFPWAYSLAIFGPTVQVEAARGSIEKFQVYGGYYFTNLNYLPSQRTVQGDRLTVQEMKVAVGLRTPIFGSFLGELQAGPSFDRQIYLGAHLFDRGDGSASIPDDWSVTWSAKYAF